MRIEITVIENHNSYRVWHDAAVLIERTTSPMCAAARVFLARGAAGLDAHGCDQMDMRATTSNADPLGIGDDRASCGRF
jgi:hypothetical protein